MRRTVRVAKISQYEKDYMPVGSVWTFHGRRFEEPGQNEKFRPLHAERSGPFPHQDYPEGGLLKILGYINDSGIRVEYVDLLEEIDEEETI